MQADSKANPFCKCDSLISSQYLGQFFPNPLMRGWEAVNYPRGTRSRVAECDSFRHTDKHVRPSLYSSSGFVTAPQSALGTGTGSVCRKLGFSDPTRCFDPAHGSGSPVTGVDNCLSCHGRLGCRWHAWICNRCGDVRTTWPANPASFGKR